MGALIPIPAPLSCSQEPLPLQLSIEVGWGNKISEGCFCSFVNSTGINGVPTTCLTLSQGGHISEQMNSRGTNTTAGGQPFRAMQMWRVLHIELYDPDMKSSPTPMP